MKRYAALDFIRGLGLTAVLIFSFAQVQGLAARGGNPAIDFLQPLAFALDFLAAGGGVFLFAAAAGLTVRTVHRVHTHPHALVFRWSLFHSLGLLLVAGLTVFVSGPFFTVFFLPGASHQLPAWLTSAQLGLPLAPFAAYLPILASPHPLFVLALMVPVLALLLRWTLRAHFEEGFSALFLLSFLAGLIMLGTGLSLSTLWLIYPGFSLLGLAAGLVMATEKHRTWALWVLALTGMVLAGAGLAGALSGRMLLVAAGFLLVLQAIALVWLDFVSGRRPGRRLRLTRSVRIFGQFSLTVWLLATPLSFVMAWFLGLILPGWNQHTSGLLLGGIFYAFTWGAVLKVWRMVRYRGTAEWLLQMFERLLGKPSTRID